MKTKDQTLLEQAYKKVYESLNTPSTPKDLTDTLSEGRDGDLENDMAYGAYVLYKHGDLDESVIQQYGGGDYEDPANNLEFWKYLGEQLASETSSISGMVSDYLDAVYYDEKHIEGEKEAIKNAYLGR